MGNESVDTLKKLLNIEEGSLIDESIELGTSVVPVVGKVYNAWKMNRFKKRLEEHDSQLKRINEKIFILDEPLKEMIQNTIFPYVLDDLIEEHQEKKIEFIINGFEYIIDEKVSDETYIISCYDTLRDLRIEELKRLLEVYVYPSEVSLEERLQSITAMFTQSEEEKILKERQEGFYEHINYKLESKGLIGTDNRKQTNAILDFISKSIDIPSMDEEKAQHDILKDRLRDSNLHYLTKFGADFVDLFKLKLKYKD